MKIGRKISALIILSVFTSVVPVAAQSKMSASNDVSEIASETDISRFVLETSVGARSLTPTPQLAMSSGDYPVTAGDVYTLAFAAGTSPVTYTVSVDSTYKFRVANLAVLNVQGWTFVQLKKQVEDIVSKNYPLSGVQFVLMSPSVFQVTINGEVNQTQIKQAWALTRLSSVISGCFTAYSSSRNIEITSANGKTATYDLFKAERFGDLSQDPYVKPGDTITIKRIERKVSLSGAVERPGSYVLEKGENLISLFEYYGGGFTDYADKNRIEINRYNPSDLSTRVFYLNEDVLSKDFELMDHDSVNIVSSSDLKPVMFVEGAIFGGHQDVASGANGTEMGKISSRFDHDTNYATLVRQIQKQFMPSADLENAYIVRGNTIIPINLNKILYDRSYFSTEVVQPYDVLRVPFKLFYVTVSGAVNNPGRYPYIPDRDWDYYIGLAGGFNESKNSGQAVRIFDSQGNKMKKGDTIVPETTIEAKSNRMSYVLNSNVTPWVSIITTFISTVALILNFVK